MARHWKIKEQALNNLGFLSPSQKRKIAILARAKKTPPPTASILEREAHQLTIKEFESLYLECAVERRAPWLANKSLKTILQTVSSNSIKRGISDSHRTTHMIYEEIIFDALTKKLAGIPFETIQKIRFQTKFFKIARSYLRVYKSNYQEIF